jgi:hypothetical protein
MLQLFKKKKDDPKGNDKTQTEKPRLSRSSSSVEPMPDLEEVNLRFRNVLEELAVPINERDTMMQMPPERKWRYVLSQTAKVTEERTGSVKGVSLLRNFTLINTSHSRGRSKTPHNTSPAGFPQNRHSRF